MNQKCGISRRKGGRECSMWGVCVYDSVRREVLYSILRRMLSSGICHVALVRTAVLGEHVASLIRVKRISEVGTTLAGTGTACTRPTQHHIPVDSILQSLP
jgi:hypothetical protein